MQNYILLALISGLMWGIAPVIHKVLLVKYQPITIMLFNSFTYAISMTMIVFFNYNVFMKDMQHIKYEDIFIMILSSIGILIIGNLIYYYVLREHESSLVSALIYSSPVFTLILAYIFLKERLSMYGYLGIFSILLGIIFISKN
jgi:chloramphenicol-sensitive protein RarD